MNKLPIKKDYIEVKDLEEICEEYIKFLNSDEYNEDEVNDYEHYIFERALEMIYGKDIWNYVNEKID